MTGYLGSALFASLRGRFRFRSGYCTFFLILASIRFLAKPGFRFGSFLVGSGSFPSLVFSQRCITYAVRTPVLNIAAEVIYIILAFGFHVVAGGRPSFRQLVARQSAPPPRASTGDHRTFIRLGLCARTASTEHAQCAGSCHPVNMAPHRPTPHKIIT